MTPSRTLIGLLLMASCTHGLAAGARIDLSSLDAAGSHPRFIVKYRDGSAERTQAAARQTALATASARSGVATTSKTPAPLQLKSVRATARGGMHVVRASRKLSRGEAEGVMRAIAADPNVEYVAVDAMVQAFEVPNDPNAGHQWHFSTGAGGARVYSAWDKGSKGAGAVVAVVDTGVTQHADLAGNLLPGYDFISDAFVSRRDSDERVPGGWDIGSWNAAGECGAGSAARDSSWHGTHVSGTIAEVTNNGLGMAGIAPDAKVVPLRVLGRCGGYTTDVADAVVWAAGGTVEGVPANPNPAEVINLSLGSAQACPTYMQDAINTAVSLGSTVVVAAGNDNADASNYSPAGCANVIVVAATGYGGARAGYSNYGAPVDLSAPGGGGIEGVPNGYIWSTHNAGKTVPAADQYVGMTGTSMASPHVAGVVALMQSIAPKPLTPAAVEGLLIASARAFPVNPGTRPIGAGILDATAAVERAKTYGQPLEARPLDPGATETMPPLAAGESVMYVVDLPAAAASLQFLSSGGRGVLRAYANYEAEPTATANIGSSTRPGTNQTITLKSVAAGRYYLKMTAASDSAGVSLRAKVL